MDFFTHFLMGILLSLFTLNSFSFSIVLYGIIMAVIADFDIILEPLKRIKDTPLLSHKGISHSYFFAFLFSGLIGIFSSILLQEPFLLVWIVGFVFYWSDILIRLLGKLALQRFQKLWRFFWLL